VLQLNKKRRGRTPADSHNQFKIGASFGFLEFKENKRMDVDK